MRSLLLLVAVVFGVGCNQPRTATTGGGTTTPAPAPAPSEADRKAMAVDLQQLALTMYLVHDNDNKAPTGLADLEPKMSGAERLIQAIKDGRVIVNWGAPINAPWWAYEKDTPVRGGLMIVPDPGRNGEMRAKEVSAADAKRILGR